MNSWRLDLEYEGTRYHGWQAQKNARTVAGELKRAIESVAGPVAEIGAAGRTDAGVHALHQVAHVRLDKALEPDAFRHAINAALPGDVHVLAATHSAPRFHARHHAESRAYLYQVSRRRTALHRRFTWTVERALDVAAMRSAIALVAGRHDFAQFCARPKEEKSTIVTVARAEIEESGALVLVRIEATHFLWRMVRRIVGALVRVGTGELTQDEFAELLAARTIDAARGDVAEWTAAASGLFLERIRYPGDAPLGPLAPATTVEGDAKQREQPGVPRAR
jgi:tRNA pseudouridine38-40 synthase